MPKSIIDRLKDVEAGTGTGGGGSVTVIQSPGATGPAGPSGPTGPAGPPGTGTGGGGFLPGGVAQVTTDITGIGTTQTSLTGLRVTVEIAANRWTRISGYAQMAQRTSTGNVQLQIREIVNPGVTTEIQAAEIDNVAAGKVVTLTPRVSKAFSAGTHTFELQALTSVATVDVLSGGGNDPIEITVEDMGPFLGVPPPPQNLPYTSTYTGATGTSWANSASSLSGTTSPWHTYTYTTGGHSGAATIDIQANKGRMLLNGTTPGAAAGYLLASDIGQSSDTELYVEFTTQGTLGSWFFDLLGRDDGQTTLVAQNAVGVRVDPTAGALSIIQYVAGATASSVAKFVQIAADTHGATTVSTAGPLLPNAQTAGNLLVCAIRFGDATHTISSVADTAGNAWTAVGSIKRGTGMSQQLYYSQNIAASAGGANTVTVTFNAAVAYADIQVAEYTGILTAGSLDQHNEAIGTSASPNSGNVTTLSAAELLVGAGVQDSAGFTAPGTGYTSRGITVGPGGDGGGNMLEDEVVASTGTYSAAGSVVGTPHWVMNVATFKASGSASAPITITTSKTYGLRVNLTGLTYKAKCWDITGTEPDWQLTYNDLSGVTPTSGGARVQFIPQGAGVSQRIDLDNFSRLDLNGSVPQLPDLTVLSLTASPTSPNVGDEVTFSATIENVGSQVTPGGVKIDVGFFVDPPDLTHIVADDPSEVAWNNNYAPAAGLLPGSTQSLTANGGPLGKATWTATAGTHNVYAFVDTHDLIQQEGAVTNIFLISLPVNVTAPTGVDVIPTDITWSPLAPVAGDTVTFSTTVLNQGDTATPISTNIRADWLVGGNAAGTETNYSPNPGLAAGASHVVTANSGLWTGVAGTWGVSVALDPGNLLGDTHRTDKTLFSTITVAPAPTGRFPLVVAGHTLVDQQGVPVLLSADSPQDAFGIVNLTNWTTYVTDRKAKGFTAVYFDALVSNAIGGRSDGRAFDGTHAPFTVGTTPNTYDISTPDTSAGGYWVQFDAFVAAVREPVLLPVIDPIETIGWMTCLRNNGVTKATGYGRFLGARYPYGIMWVHGNDFGGVNAGNTGTQYPQASDDALVQAVRDGIKATDPTSLHTVEFNVLGSPITAGSASTDETAWQSRVDLDGDYTYNPTYDRIIRSVTRTGAKPAFHVEGNYENSNFTFNGGAATTASIRRQAWWTITSGGAGFFYGRGVGIDAGTYDTTGVTQLGYLFNLLSGRAWQLLAPDGGVNGTGATLIVSGRGTYSNTGDPNTNTWITAAKTPDKTLAILFLPQAGSPTVNMAQMAGQTTARWYDPTTGTFTAITGSPFTNVGNRTFTPPAAAHSDGTHDWVLLLEAVVGPPPTGVKAYGIAAHDAYAFGNLPAYTQELQVAKNAGATWVRVDCPGVSTNMDNIVAASRNLGLKLCLVLGGSTKSLSAATCSAVAARYGPSSTLKGANSVEFLNEPNCGAGGAPLTGAQYWNLIGTGNPSCIQAVTNADPLLQKWIGAVCNGGSISTMAWVTQLIAASGTLPAGCDISIHDYGSYSTALADIRTTLNSNGMSDRLIHVTEDGADTIHSTEAAQATFYTNHINTWKATAGLGVLIFYELRDINSADNVPFDHFGIYHTDFTAKPAAAAFTNGVTTP